MAAAAKNAKSLLGAGNDSKFFFEVFFGFFSIRFFLFPALVDGDFNSEKSAQSYH
jgi:hypothetical protein